MRIKVEVINEDGAVRLKFPKTSIGMMSNLKSGLYSVDFTEVGIEVKDHTQPWLPATAPNTVIRLIDNKNQCMFCMVEKVFSGLARALRKNNACRNKGSNTNSINVKINQTMTIMVIHQYSNWPKRLHAFSV